jgi:hypothetical protein
VIRIPVDSSAKLYRFNTSIEDLEVVFTVYWNRIDQAWYFDLSDVKDKVLARGIKIVLGAYLGSANTDSFFSKGAFVALDTSNEGRNATVEDLGSRVQLWWLDALSIQGIQDEQFV